MLQSQLQDFRQRYPQYDDMSDADLADALYDQYYSDIERAQFDEQLGLTAAPAGVQPSLETAGPTIQAGLNTLRSALDSSVRLSDEDAAEEYGERVGDRQEELNDYVRETMDIVRGDPATMLVQHTNVRNMLGSSRMGEDGVMQGGRYDGLTAHEALLQMGMTAEQIEQNHRDHLDRRHARTDELEQRLNRTVTAGAPEFTRAADLASRVPYGTSRVVTGTGQGLGWAQSELENAAHRLGLREDVATPPSQTAIGRASTALDQDIKGSMWMDRIRDEDLTSQIGEGIGQAPAFMVPGAAVSRVAGPVAGMSTTAAIGSAVNSGGAIQDAAAHGATPAQERAAGRVGAITGTTEVLGAGRIAAFRNGAIGGPIRNTLGRGARNAAQEMVEEGLQEGFQTAAQNVQAGRSYDPDRAASEGLAESVIVGAATGATVGGVTGLIMPDQAATDRMRGSQQMDGLVNRVREIGRGDDRLATYQREFLEGLGIEVNTNDEQALREQITQAVANMPESALQDQDLAALAEEMRSLDTLGRETRDLHEETALIQRRDELQDEYDTRWADMTAAGATLPERINELAPIRQELEQLDLQIERAGLNDGQTAALPVIDRHINDIRSQLVTTGMAQEEVDANTEIVRAALTAMARKDPAAVPEYLERLRVNIERGDPQVDTETGTLLDQEQLRSIDDMEAAARDAGVALSLSERGGDIILNRIVAETQGAGAGTQVMNDLTAWADARGSRLVLTPEQIGSTSQARLTAFYERHGFIKNTGRNRDFEIRETMYREPRQEPEGFYQGDGTADTQSEAFRNWFGDSQVRDEAGEPLVVYHGTPDARGLLDNGAFEISPLSDGIFFTNSRGVARTYADDRRALDYQNARPAVGQFFLALQNPMVIDANGQSWGERGGPASQEEQIRQAREAGHDGLVIRNTLDTYDVQGRELADVFVAFEPTQIKSAETGPAVDLFDGSEIEGSGPNRGTWDPNDPRILNQGAWHGTHAKFDRFRTDKINSGEEAQAFGWGIYFASRKDIAQWYRRTQERKKKRPARLGLTMPNGKTKTLNGTWRIGDSVNTVVRQIPADARKGMSSALLRRAAREYLMLRLGRNALHGQLYETLRGANAENKDFAEVLAWSITGRELLSGTRREPKQKHIDAMLAVVEAVDSRIEVKQPGHLYRVEIPDEGNYLDWDTKVTDQSPMVRDALDGLGVGNSNIFTVERAPNGKGWHVVDGLGVVDGKFGNRRAAEAQRDEQNGRYGVASSFTGEQVYNALVRQEYDKLNIAQFADNKAATLEAQKRASLLLADYGVPGIQYLDNPSRGAVSEKTRNYVVFDDKNIDIVERYNQTARASITIPGGGVFNGETLIRLGEKSDASSFMHEAAHLFLEMYREMAQDSRAIEREYRSIERWLRVPMGQKPTVEQHEQFAEAFELYLAEGRAPTPQLRRVFDAFRRWLADVYRALVASGKSKLRPQARTVFDRMLSEPDTTAAPPAPGQRGRQVTPSDPKAVEPGVALADAITALRKALPDMPVRNGRLTRRGALGTFSPRSGVVRLKVGSDFDTLSHEAGHHLAMRYRDAFNTVVRGAEPELNILARGVNHDASTRLDEGFAELVRLYMTNRPYLRKHANSALVVFENAFRQESAELMDGLDRAYEAFDVFIRQPSGASIAADTVQTREGRGLTGLINRLTNPAEQGGAIKRFLDRLYTSYIDRLNPILVAQRRIEDVYEAATGERLNINPGENAYMLARLSTNAQSAGHMDIMHGVTPHKKLDPEGPGLADALELALGTPEAGMGKFDDQQLRQFDAYLISRRSVQEWGRYDRGELPNAPDKFSADEHLQNIAELEQAFPKFREAAEMVYEWNTRLLAKKRDAGLITGEQFIAFTENHPDYVPFLRDMGAERAGVGSAVAGNNKDNRVRQFRGSDRAIISPIESMARDAYMTASSVARNDMIGALMDLSERAGMLGGGQVIEEIPATRMKGTRVNAVEALEAAAQEADIAPRDAAALVNSVNQALDGQTFATIYRSAEANELGEPIIYHWRDGKRRMLRVADGELGREMMNAIVGLGPDNLGFATKLFSAFSSGLRMGVTTSPDFMAANYFRDQISAWVLTDEGFIPGISGLIGIAKELNQGRTSRRYNLAGGVMGGANVAAVNDGRIKADLNALRKKGYRVRRYGSWKGFAAASEIPETGTRLALFDLAFKNSKKAGLSDWDALVYGSYTASDYTDYSRSGSRMVHARRILTFLNVGLQGPDKARRVLTGGNALRRALRPLFGRKANLTASEKKELRHAVKAWFLVVFVLGGFGLALTSLYHDDPEYAEISEYLRDTSWPVKIAGEWVFLPKPFDLANVSNIFERAYEAEVYNDPNAYARMRRGLVRLNTPPISNPLMTVPWELWANKSTFSGRDIVPRHMQGLPPVMQHNHYTSEFSRVLGEHVGVSPMKVDHVIAGFGGTWGRTFLNASDTLLRSGDTPAPATGPEDEWVIRRFVKDPMRGSQTLNDFWDQMNATGNNLTAVSNAFRNKADAGDPEAAVAFILQRDPIERDYAILQNAPFPPAMRRLHPMNRAEAAMSVNRGMMLELDTTGLRRPGTEEIIELTPAQRRDAISVLRGLNVLEAQDAMHLTGFVGFAERPRLDRADLLNELAAISPHLTAQYRQRQVAGRVPPIEVVESQWPVLRDRLRRFDMPGEVDPIARMRRAQTLENEL